MVIYANVVNFAYSASLHILSHYALLLMTCLDSDTQHKRDPIKLNSVLTALQFNPSTIHVEVHYSNDCISGGNRTTAAVLVLVESQES